MVVLVMAAAWAKGSTGAVSALASMVLTAEVTGVITKGAVGVGKVPSPSAPGNGVGSKLSPMGVGVSVGKPPPTWLGSVVGVAKGSTKGVAKGSTNGVANGVAKGSTKGVAKGSLTDCDAVSGMVEVRIVVGVKALVGVKSGVGVGVGWAEIPKP